MRRQAGHLHHRPNFDGPQACAWNPSGDVDRLVEIPGVDQEVAAQLFARLRERTVGHEPFALAHPDAGRRRNRVQRGGSKILPGPPDLARKLHGLLATLLLLGLIRGLFITVHQQHIFHLVASILAGASPRPWPLRRERAPPPSRPSRATGYPAAGGTDPARRRRSSRTAGVAA